MNDFFNCNRNWLQIADSSVADEGYRNVASFYLRIEQKSENIIYLWMYS